MDVQLRVLSGKLTAGTQPGGSTTGSTTGSTAPGVVESVPLRGKRFVIGSDEHCHMVCKSRKISPRHCVIAVDARGVFALDMGSETGTFVNDVRIAQPQRLRSGDRLRVGRLEFEIYIATALPQVALQIAPQIAPQGADAGPAKGVPADTVVQSAPPDTVEAQIAELLQQEDQAERAHRLEDPGSRFFRLEPAQASQAAPHEDPSAADAKKKPTPKPPGKLPPRPEISGPDSVSAAEQAVAAMFRSPTRRRKP